MPTERGTVSAYDETRGFGEITADSTGAVSFFHATQIADGTRTISVGAAVEFELVAGGRGRYEAIRVTRAAGEVENEVFRCPVCNVAIEGQARAYEICGRCGWEDDPAQFEDPLSRGANTETLNEARVAWKQKERAADA